MSTDSHQNPSALARGAVKRDSRRGSGVDISERLHNPTDDERAQVSALIVETKLAPIGDV